MTNEEQLMAKISEALKKGGAIYDFDTVDAMFAVRDLIHEQRREEVEESKGKSREAMVQFADLAFARMNGETHEHMHDGLERILNSLFPSRG